jgi:hypothetical protein
VNRKNSRKQRDKKIPKPRRGSSIIKLLSLPPMAPFGVVRGDDSHDDDGSHALIGYGAAVLACLAFGSFAVPIKSARANRIHVDPLGMKRQKMC